MKRIIALFISLFMVACLFSACEENKPTEEKETEKNGKIIYVSVDGNDSNDGTESSPLATFGGAVAKVREYKTANGLPDGGIKVEFESGIYKVTEGVVFTDEDSGEEGKPIVYAAADGSEVASERWCCWPVAISWTPGYKYTYTIDLAGGGYEETNVDGDPELDPVLGGQEIIFVGCTVDAWDEFNKDIVM